MGPQHRCATMPDLSSYLEENNSLWFEPLPTLPLSDLLPTLSAFPSACLEEGHPVTQEVESDGNTELKELLKRSHSLLQGKRFWFILFLGKK